MAPSFAHPTPEDSKFPDFAQDIQLAQMPATVVVLLEYFSPREIEVPRMEDMEAFLGRLDPGHPRLVYPGLPYPPSPWCTR